MPKKEKASLLLKANPQALWIARGLGRSVADLVQIEAGNEAGREAGKVFYILSLAGLKLAVSADGLRAYAIDVDVETADETRLAELLESCGLSAPDLSPLKSVRQAFTQASRAWIRVAVGQPPTPTTAECIEYLYPGKPERILDAEKLGGFTAKLHDLLSAPRLNRKRVANARALVAIEGEVLARGISAVEGHPGQDIFGREIQPSVQAGAIRLAAGPGVRVSPQGEFRAERYGYAYLAEGRLSIVSPLWIDADKMCVYWIVLDGRLQPITTETIGQWLADLGVVEGIQGDKIARLVKEVREGAHKRGSFLVATGQPPQDGQDARMEILVDMERRIGKEREDGSIDFREGNYTSNVQTGQLVARYAPPIPGSPGRDVKGCVCPEREGIDRLLQPGSNIRVEEEGDLRRFYATGNGTLRIYGDTLSVVDVLVIPGDVSFNTGNLSFSGEIYISGSVMQGFSVKADKAVTISGTVEPGASVISLQDISVGRGIVGSRTEVWAQGSVRAQFVQEAQVTAEEGDIELGCYAYHARLQAGGTIKISRGLGQNEGSIIGGQTWAHRYIETYIAGAWNGIQTSLVGGVDSEQIRALDKLDRSIKASSARIESILERFGLGSIDVEHIRNMVKASAGPRRKILAQQARQLGQLVQVHQKLLERRQVLKRKWGPGLREVEIKVWDRAFPGVVIRLGGQMRQLTEEVRGVRYYLEDDELVESQVHGPVVDHA